MSLPFIPEFIPMNCHGLHIVDNVRDLVGSFLKFPTEWTPIEGVTCKRGGENFNFDRAEICYEKSGYIAFGLYPTKETLRLILFTRPTSDSNKLEGRCPGGREIEITLS